LHNGRPLSTPAWEAMAAGLVFRQLFCRAAGCREMFFICLSCYRGQTYCSAECRQKTRREQLRQANRRYQRSLEARLDHRDRQREYRRRRFCRVRDLSSPTSSSCGRIGRARALVSTVPPLPSFSERDAPFVRPIDERKAQACAKAMFQQ